MIPKNQVSPLTAGGQISIVVTWAQAYTYVGKSYYGYTSGTPEISLAFNIITTEYEYVRTFFVNVVSPSD